MVLDQLNGAIATGQINEVLPGLVGAEECAYTVASFWERFRDEYCKPRMSSWRRYQQSFNAILPALGPLPLQEFDRGDLHEYLEKRTRKVSRSTANRDMAALKKMFSYAVEVGAVESHPLARFRAFRVQEQALRIPTLEQYRRLVDAMPTPELAGLVALLGETGMRRNEALDLTWDRLDLRGRRVTLEQTKGMRVRSIPLSDYAIEKLRGIIRFVGQPHVFCYSAWKPGSRMVKPYAAFRVAASGIGLGWVTFHTLRHMRATLWLQAGADVRTVKEALGHSAIATTMRYLQHVETHADKALRDAQEKEAALIIERDKSGRGNA